MTINDPRSSLLMIPQVEQPLVLHGHWLWLCPMVSTPERRLMELAFIRSIASIMAKGKENKANESGK